VPARLLELVGGDGPSARSEIAATLQMKKIEISALEAAARG
jgi:hypothetical protein